MFLLSCVGEKAKFVGQCGTLLLGRLTWKPVRTMSGRCVYVLGRGGRASNGRVGNDIGQVVVGGKVVVSALVVLSRTARRKRLFLRRTFVS